MSIRLYRTGDVWDLTIEIVNVDRITSSYVWIDGHRFKRGNSLVYHESFAKAKAHLLNRAHNIMETAKKALVLAHGDLDQAYQRMAIIEHLTEESCQEARNARSSELE